MFGWLVALRPSSMQLYLINIIMTTMVTILMIMMMMITTTTTIYHSIHFMIIIITIIIIDIIIIIGIIIIIIVTILIFSITTITTTILSSWVSVSLLLLLLSWLFSQLICQNPHSSAESCQCPWTWFLVAGSTPLQTSWSPPNSLAHPCSDANRCVWSQLTD